MSREANVHGDLERELRELGDGLRREPTPDLAGAVRRRLQTPVRPNRLPFGRRPDRRTRRRLGVAIGVVAALVITLIALPADAREDLLSWLHIHGVTVTHAPSPTAPSPTAPRPSSTTELGMGQPVTFDEAQRAVNFEIARPNDDRLAHPASVLLGRAASGIVAVTLVYPPAPGLPGSPQTGTGAILSEFVGGVHQEVIRKILYTDPGARETQVHEVTALWIDGPQDVALAFGDVTDAPFTPRPSANSLLWVRNGITFRLEAEVSLDVALQIANSIP